MFRIGVGRFWFVKTDNDNSENGMERTQWAEERFRIAFQNSRDILYCVNIKTGLYEYFSPSLKTITGYDPDNIMELGNIGFGFLVHPGDLDILAQHILQVAAIRGDQNETYTVEYRFRCKDGRYIWLSDNHAVTRDAAGVPEFFIGNLRDVTGRRRIEQELRDSDARLRAMLDNGIDLINLLDEDGNILFESSDAGPPVDDSDEYEPTSIFYWVHPEDRPGVLAAFKDLASRPGEQINIELRIRNADGGWRAYECRAVNRLQDPLVRGMVINSHDITERREAEQALRDSESRFRAMLENGTDLITLLDEKGTILFESPASGSLL
jgi:PAS domain S-box-containing protein